MLSGISARYNTERKKVYIPEGKPEYIDEGVTLQVRHVVKGVLPC